MFPSTLPVPRLTAASQVPQLRWGIIGPGWIADHFAHALRKHTHQQITAVAARDPAKAQAFADKWSISHATGSIDVLLAREDVDAVYIACLLYTSQPSSMNCVSKSLMLHCTR